MTDERRHARKDALPSSTALHLMCATSPIGRPAGYGTCRWARNHGKPLRYSRLSRLDEDHLHHTKAKRRVVQGNDYTFPPSLVNRRVPCRPKCDRACSCIRYRSTASHLWTATTLLWNSIAIRTNGTWNQVLRISIELNTCVYKLHQRVGRSPLDYSI